MFSTAIRLLLLYTVIWLLSDYSDELLTTVAAALRTTAKSLGDGPLISGLAAYALFLFVIRLVSGALWAAPVPLDATNGEIGIAIGRRALGVELKLRRSRFLFAFFLEGLILLVALRVLPDVIDPSGIALPGWLAPGETRQDWFRVCIAHVLAVVAGGIVWRLALTTTDRKSRSLVGFLRSQIETQKSPTVFKRLVLFVHLPLSMYATGSLPHPLFLPLVGLSLISMLPGLLSAWVTTTVIERRHDRWLRTLDAQAARGPEQPATLIRIRVLDRLHPGRASFPLPMDDGEAIAKATPPPAAGNVSPLEATDPAPEPTAAPDLPLESTPEPVRTVRDRPRGRLLKSAAAALGFSVLMAAIALAWQWITLPSAEETRQLARSAHIHVRKTSAESGPAVELLGNRYDYSLNTRLGNVSPHFVNAIIASEDHRFFEHGVVYKIGKFLEAGLACVVRKLNLLADSRACRGNSTIGQQLARNLFLSETRTIGRKLKELLWALKMETGLDKDEILELYLNRVYLGKGNFGIEMASRSYFQKSAKDLNVAEAAYIAAAVKRPGWNWHEDTQRASRRARLIVALMRRHGFVPSTTYFPEEFSPRVGRRLLHKPYLGHLWQWLRPEVKRVLGAYPDGKYKVLTTLNAEVEVYAERHLETELRRLQRAGVKAGQGAVVAMRPSGEILAMVGGIGKSVVARGTNRAKRTAGLLPRPPASAFKPVVYLAALEGGLRRDSMIDAGPVSIAMPNAKPYRPQNHDGRTYGRVTMRDGLVRSINTAAVRLLRDRVGFDGLLNAAERLGIHTAGFERLWGLALGQAGVPLIELVSAYGVFANGGFSVSPFGIVSVTDERGKTVWRRPKPPSQRLFPARAVGDLNMMLRDVVKHGTARRAGRNLMPRGDLAGKTGTGDDFVDAWFVGYSADLVMGIWIGNDNPTTMSGVYGGAAPAVVFNRIFGDLIRYTDTVSAGGPLP